jgi:FtsZ-binding cell division protein ZapB
MQTIDHLIKELTECKEERDMLANENENLGNFLDNLDYSQNEIDNIANGFPRKYTHRSIINHNGLV